MAGPAEYLTWASIQEFSPSISGDMEDVFGLHFASLWAESVQIRGGFGDWTPQQMAASDLLLNMTAASVPPSMWEHLHFIRSHSLRRKLRQIARDSEGSVNTSMTLAPPIASDTNAAFESNTDIHDDARPPAGQPVPRYGNFTEAGMDIDRPGRPAAVRDTSALEEACHRALLAGTHEIADVHVVACCVCGRVHFNYDCHDNESLVLLTFS